ncbi:Lrp/AsnC family transcriptional regulator [Microbacterium rhizomatis]|uniref:Lrp/AsnC family transcriptional regulator n=1 Tax=Microbacterium rhizomatis TaxID=1631477 RepID=A0A5J5IZA0_9MICO|nr:Lrp/AsnC family transcriptional regulator [Microbacterium rhizomatis]KAA9106547.1 Lrp/AsnC family transcriptional regulator [Microbacterium rhizomatis]
MERKTLRQDLDDVDRRLIAALAADGRITNAELAARVGLAPSTVHGRVQSLIQSGVISGFTATVNKAKLGFGLQALVGVTLAPGARQASITDFADHARAFPEVVQVFFLGGVDDFMVHVAVADSSALRTFVVEHISGHPRVASTRTNIIFDYHRSASVESFR